MEKSRHNTYKLDSISDVHRLFALPKPLHPLISLIDNTNDQLDLGRLPPFHVLNYYKISYKAKLNGKFKYGQGYYDFDEGGLLFAAPNQILGSHDQLTEQTGYTLLIHPDFFLGSPMAKKIKQYGFFSYAVNEALHLSDQETTTVLSLFKIMQEELAGRIDDFSQDVMIAQIDLLLTYANRFYKRQFITRKAASNELLQKLEALLDDYFNNEKTLNPGILTVQFLADQLSISASYLRRCWGIEKGESRVNFVATKQ